MVDAAEHTALICGIGTAASRGNQPNNTAGYIQAIGIYAPVADPTEKTVSLINQTYVKSGKRGREVRTMPIDMKARFEHVRYNQERYADFLEWLFDTELSYTTQSEMWEKFEKYESEIDRLQSQQL